jgi:hypothetical protein
MRARYSTSAKADLRRASRRLVTVRTNNGAGGSVECTTDSAWHIISK